MGIKRRKQAPRSQSIRTYSRYLPFNFSVMPESKMYILYLVDCDVLNTPI